ncbi:Hypothetical predicted protein [Olea europaea subsp. europaea]|uniref:Uncharacterized protein n=1 Tax=Olea europaea subsp. europaea TaxID=158383 RepID=A0A8S0QJS3_OLEEU|nr:Hypothetical predicted protein [Olea europaea subsp. europaea]
MFMECEIKGKPASILVDEFNEASIVPPSDSGLDDSAKYTSGLTTYQQVWEAVTLADQSAVGVGGPVEAKQQTLSSFVDVFKNLDKPVLVDFFATWKVQWLLRKLIHHIETLLKS